MRPIRSIPATDCRRVRVWATDIDDTLTTEGTIPAVAFQALWAAHQAGIAVVPVTGRPAGWCDHIARMWPVAGVIGENGGLWFRHAGGNPGRVERGWVFDQKTRAANRERLQAVREAILREVPGSAVASDQDWREFDLAIDYCEDVPRLPPEAVDRIVAVFREHGCTAKVSSIHVNGWFGDYDKLGMLRRFLRETLGQDERGVLFTGDSPNDEPMFAHFPLSVGVANIAEFASRLTHPPAYVTGKRGGEGFAEAVRIVLSRGRPARPRYRSRPRRG